MPPSWTAFLAAVEQELNTRGSWSGEAMVLRDAAGRKRLGASGGQLVVDALGAAGYELEPEFGHPPRFESEIVFIRRAGGGELARTIEALLPHIRKVDRMIPADVLWRDHLVAQTAIRGWRGEDAS